MTITRTATALAAALALSGCFGLGGGKPPAQLYTLSPDATAPAGTGAQASSSGSTPVVVAAGGLAATVSTPTAPQVIVVSEPSAPRALAVNRMPVQLDATRIAYLKDAVWAEHPTALFRNLLIETLRRDTHRIVLADDDLAARGGLRLSGQLLAMGYDTSTSPHSVVVRFEALRSTAKGQFASQRFEATVPDVAPNANAVAAALNVAANQVAHQVAAWMVGQ